MKHWCYYARVVSYLERIEARQAKNTPTGAYLVWRDEDGSPWMVAGPDIDWFRGDGPVPDIVGLRPSVKDRSMPKTESRTQQPRARQAEPRTQVTGQHMTKGQPVMTRQQVTGQQVTGQQATGQQATGQQATGQQAMSRQQVTEATCISQQDRHVTNASGQKKANKRRTHFLKTAQKRSNQLKSAQTFSPRGKKQRRGRQSTVTRAPIPISSHRVTCKPSRAAAACLDKPPLSGRDKQDFVSMRSVHKGFAQNLNRVSGMNESTRGFLTTLSFSIRLLSRAAALADLLLPDILTVNVENSDGFLNGRGLADDVIDAELNLLTDGAIPTDCIDENDKDFLTIFPYLAPPH